MYSGGTSSFPEDVGRRCRTFAAARRARTRRAHAPPRDTRLSPRDPDLDVLLLRFHLETGARRQGALGLRVADLDHARSTVWLHEKGNADREQPVAPTLLEHLVGFAGERGGQGV
jgi:integrase